MKQNTLTSKKRRVVVLLLLLCVLPLSMCGTCIVCAVHVSERNRERIEAMRAQCLPPQVFRVREGGNPYNPDDHECVSQELIQAEEQERRELAEAEERRRQEQQRRAQELAAEAARVEKAREQERIRIARAQAEESARIAEQHQKAFRALIKSLNALCKEYTSETHMGRLSRLEADHRKLTWDARLVDVKGTVMSNSSATSSGPVRMKELRISILVDEKHVFRSSDRPWRGNDYNQRYDEVFEQVRQIGAGTCVVFSAWGLEPIVTRRGTRDFERLRLCADDFAVQFSDIRRCSE